MATNITTIIIYITVTNVKNTTVADRPWVVLSTLYRMQPPLLSYSQQLCLHHLTTKNTINM